MVKDAVPRMRVVDGGTKAPVGEEEQVRPPQVIVPAEDAPSLTFPLTIFLGAAATSGAAVAWISSQGMFS